MFNTNGTLEIGAHTVRTKRLYHFLKACHAIDDLKEKRIKLSIFGEVNDTQELEACFFPGYENNMDQLKAFLKNTFRFLCLAPDAASQYMWKWYGDEDRGICFGLEVNKEHLNTVSYVEHKCIIDLPGDLKSQIIQEWRRNHGRLSELELQSTETIKQVLLTKTTRWSEEQEERLFFTSEAKKIGKFYFADFSPDLYLQEVILGRLCSTSENEIANLIESYLPQPVRIRRNQ